MPTPATADTAELDAATAELVQSHIVELLRASRRGVTEPEATKAYCHCNDADCERCQAQVYRATQAVAEAHARMYPHIADAMDAARYGNPGPAVRELLAQYGAKIAELTAAVAALAPHAEAPKGASK